MENRDLLALQKCTICGHTRAWHEENRPHHQFDPDGSVPFKATFGARRDRERTIDAQRAPEGPSEAAWPFDPVLRQALIDKGVLTPNDLVAAEQKIRAITAQFSQEGPWSQTKAASTDSSTETDSGSTRP